MIWPLSHTLCSIIVINFCIRYACPIVICDIAVGASCHASLKHISQSDVIMVFGMLNACPVTEPPHNYFAFVFLLPTPLLDLLNSTATYASHHFTPQTKMLLCYCWSNRASSSIRKPTLALHHRNVGHWCRASWNPSCQVPCGYLQWSPHSRTKVLFWPRHQQTRVILPDYNNKGSPKEYAQPQWTSHQITVLATQSWPQPHFFRQMQA